MRCGRGVMTLPSGEVYDGDWLLDEPTDKDKGLGFI
jgi:hypothetical protein